MRCDMRQVSMLEDKVKGLKKEEVTLRQCRLTMLRETHGEVSQSDVPEVRTHCQVFRSS